MAWANMQVTIGPGPTQISPGVPGQQIFCRQVMVQNNAANDCRIGGKRVTATMGIVLKAVSGGGGGSFNSGPVSIYNTYLSDLWLAGTQGDLIDVMFNT